MEYFPSKDLKQSRALRTLGVGKGDNVYDGMSQKTDRIMFGGRDQCKHSSEFWSFCTRLNRHSALKRVKSITGRTKSVVIG